MNNIEDLVDVLNDMALEGPEGGDQSEVAEYQCRVLECAASLARGGDHNVLAVVQAAHELVLRIDHRQ